jgi:hypothetical protein
MLSTSDIRLKHRTAVIFPNVHLHTVFPTHTHKICRYIYDLPSYPTPRALLQWFIIYRHQAESYRKFSHDCHVAILHSKKMLTNSAYFSKAYCRTPLSGLERKRPWSRSNVTSSHIRDFITNVSKPKVVVGLLFGVLLFIPIFG